MFDDERRRRDGALHRRFDGRGKRNWREGSVEYGGGLVRGERFAASFLACVHLLLALTRLRTFVLAVVVALLLLVRLGQRVPLGPVGVRRGADKLADG